LERALQWFQGGRGGAAETIVRRVFQHDFRRFSADHVNVALAVLAMDDGRMDDAWEHAERVQADPPNWDRNMNAWLDELPEARAFFE
jgi:hypothetical protein